MIGLTTILPKVGDVAKMKAHQTVSYHGGFTVEWSVQAPAGSMSSFLPDTSALNPIFLIDVPGEYTFTIEVEDDCGLTSTYTWPVHTATPKDEQGLRVQLSWVGEGGESATGYNPHGVADLDLHFTHPQAPFDPEQVGDLDGDGAADPYFDPYGGDCYYNSVMPDWGVELNPLDNPQYLVNTAAGPGPETVKFKQPEGLKYRIATIHNGGWGPGWDGAAGVPSPAEALALVAILKDGAVTATTTMDLVPGDLWCAGMVHGGTGALTPCPNLANPVTPNYPSP